jgi:hypothetical protein
MQPTLARVVLVSALHINAQNGPKGVVKKKYTLLFRGMVWLAGMGLR